MNKNSSNEQDGKDETGTEVQLKESKRWWTRWNCKERKKTGANNETGIYVETGW